MKLLRLNKLCDWLCMCANIWTSYMFNLSRWCVLWMVVHCECIQCVFKSFKFLHIKVESFKVCILLMFDLLFIHFCYLYLQLLLNKRMIFTFTYIFALGFIICLKNSLRIQPILKANWVDIPKTFKKQLGFPKTQLDFFFFCHN
jgi:hypothetical protein